MGKPKQGDNQTTRRPSIRKTTPQPTENVEGSEQNEHIISDLKVDQTSPIITTESIPIDSDNTTINTPAQPPAKKATKKKTKTKTECSNLVDYWNTDETQELYGKGRRRTKSNTTDHKTANTTIDEMANLARSRNKTNIHTNLTNVVTDTSQNENEVKAQLREIESSVSTPIDVLDEINSPVEIISTQSSTIDIVGDISSLNEVARSVSPQYEMKTIDKPFEIVTDINPSTPLVASIADNAHSIDRDVVATNVLQEGAMIIDPSHEQEAIAFNQKSKLQSASALIAVPDKMLETKTVDFDQNIKLNSRSPKRKASDTEIEDSDAALIQLKEAKLSSDEYDITSGSTKPTKKRSTTNAKKNLMNGINEQRMENDIYKPTNDDVDDDFIPEIAKPKPKAKSKATTKPKANTKAKPKAEAKTETKAKSKAKAKLSPSSSSFTTTTTTTADNDVAADVPVDVASTSEEANVLNSPKRATRGKRKLQAEYKEDFDLVGDDDFVDPTNETNVQNVHAPESTEDETAQQSFEVNTTARRQPARKTRDKKMPQPEYVEDFVMEEVTATDVPESETISKESKQQFSESKATARRPPAKKPDSRKKLPPGYVYEFELESDDDEETTEENEQPEISDLTESSTARRQPIRKSRAKKKPELDYADDDDDDDMEDFIDEQDEEAADSFDDEPEERDPKELEYHLEDEKSFLATADLKVSVFIDWLLFVLILSYLFFLHTNNRHLYPNY
jgi:hypothetical protein